MKYFIEIPIKLPFLLLLISFLVSSKNILVISWGIALLMISLDKVTNILLYKIFQDKTKLHGFIKISIQYLHIVNILIVCCATTLWALPIDICVRYGDHRSVLFLPVYYQHHTTMVEKKLELRGLKKNRDFIIYERCSLTDDVKYAIVFIICSTVPENQILTPSAFIPEL
ncbi:MAG: hypothetical protein LBI18_05845 [Planctomycetaceae bacterium]|jgi:hypothetical protein|nr:hypothetical protein [Planctomycetaceae bacterium]